MSELVIRIPGEPFAQPRARAAIIAGRAVIYDPKKAKAWKATAMHFMMNAKFEAHGQLGHLGPVALSVLAVFTCPKSDERKRDPRPRRWHTKKPDGDNVLKAVKDAAKGILWMDDSQVARAAVTKIIGAQGEAPFVELTVELLDEGGDAPCHSLTPTSNPAPASTPPAGADNRNLFDPQEER